MTALGSVSFALGAPNTGFVLSEADGHYSRENGVVILGQQLKAGTVVQTTEFSSTPNVTTTSGSTAAALDATTGLIPGRTYAISASGIPADTTFVAPETGLDIVLSHAATATHSTPEAATVSHAADMLEAWDGSDDTNAVGVLLYNVNATEMDVGASYIARNAEVNLKGLFYPDTFDPTLALANIGIIARD